MKNQFASYKIILVSILLLIISLSCDNQEATPVETPTLDYTITINSEVRNCNNVGCLQECVGSNGCSAYTSFTECNDSQLDCEWTTIENEAYNANVDNINDNYEGYYLFFQIQLKDIDGAPVEDAEISFIVDWDNETSESVNANFMKFNDITDAAGRIEGYWADAGQIGDFILTSKFIDANSTVYSIDYPVSIYPTSDVVTSIEVEVAQIEMIIEGGTETNTIYARVKNAADQLLENVDVVFEITNGSGSLSNTISSTECNLITNDDNEEFCDTYASISYFSESGIDEDII